MSARGLTSKLLGSAFVLLTTVLWVIASFLCQYLVRPDAWGTTHTLQPVILVFICTSLFSVYVPVLALKHSCSGHSRPHSQEAELRSEGPWLSSIPSSAVKVLPVATIWFAAQYTFTLSLAHTSVTSNTILSSSSSMFTLLASALLLQERITWAKLASVASVMAGTAMVTLADESADDDGSRSLLGDGMCVLAATLYALYTVALQKQLGEDDPDAPALFFGHIGIMTLAAGVPAIAAAQLLGWFRVQQLDPKAVALAGVNGVMDYVLADYTWARAVLLLGPTAATLGMSIQIPLATAADLLLGHPQWLASVQATLLTAAGTAAILAGVFGINLAGEGSRNDQQAAATAEGTAESSLQEPLLQPLHSQA